MKTLGSFWVEFEVVNMMEISSNKCTENRNLNDIKSKENKGRVEKHERKKIQWRHYAAY